MTSQNPNRHVQLEDTSNYKKPKIFYYLLIYFLEFSKKKKIKNWKKKKKTQPKTSFIAKQGLIIGLVTKHALIWFSYFPTRVLHFYY